MASYHMSVKPISRSSGRSAVAADAYREGIEMTNERDGLKHDYSKRRDVECSFTVLPKGAPEWAQDSEKLWNAAEAAETRKNAQTAREYELALPAELNSRERRELVREFAVSLTERYGVAVTASIHAPHSYGDDRNFHAHVLTTTRRMTPFGLAEKTRELDDKITGSQQVMALREEWGKMTNHALRQAGHDVRVDHRSHKARGIEQEPTVHLGVAAAAMERRAQRDMGADYAPVTEIGQKNAEIMQRISLSASLKQRLEAQLERFTKMIERVDGWFRKREQQQELQTPEQAQERGALSPSPSSYGQAQREASREDKWERLRARAASVAQPDGGGERVAGGVLRAAVEQSRQEREAHTAQEKQRQHNLELQQKQQIELQRQREIKRGYDGPKL